MSDEEPTVEKSETLEEAMESVLCIRPLNSTTKPDILHLHTYIF